MTDSELDWLNEYHRNVRMSLWELMAKMFPDSLEYLEAETKPLLRA
jgi:hypothetical protein